MTVINYIYSYQKSKIKINKPSTSCCIAIADVLAPAMNLKK